MERPEIKELNDEIIYVEVPNQYIPVQVSDIVVLLVRHFDVMGYESIYHEVALKNGVLLAGRGYPQEDSSALAQARNLLRYMGRL